MTQTIHKSPLAERLLAAHDGVPSQNAVLAATRLEALARFESLDFPTIRHEEWKYTNLRNLVNQDFTINAPAGRVTAADLSGVFIADETATRLVFVNGVYRADLSRTVPADGLTVSSFGEAVTQHADVVERHFARYADHQKDALTALNTAYAQEGAFVFVADRAVIEQPIYVYFVSDGQDTAAFSQLRNLVVAGRSSQVKIVTVCHTLGAQRSFANLVTEAVVAENASVEYYTLQNETEQAHFIGTVQAQIERDAHFAAHTVSLNGALIRNNLNLALDGSGIEAHMYGLYLLNGSSHVDNHTLVDHRKPHSYSNELYKGILDGKSTGVFNGKIYVKPDAQKTNAFQSNRNLVLSKEAAMNTKPQLEIFADDVKCSHGATVGQLDDEMLFYLRSRGIGADQAKALLMRAFADDVLQNITIEAVRHHVDGWIAQRFA